MSDLPENVERGLLLLAENMRRLAEEMKATRRVQADLAGELARLNDALLRSSRPTGATGSDIVSALLRLARKIG
jgi:hypothetical protein